MDITILVEKTTPMALEYVEILAWSVTLLLIGLIVWWLVLRRR